MGIAAVNQHNTGIADFAPGGVFNGGPRYGDLGGITWRTIIFSFPSEEDADNWWADEGYQELSKHRRAATDITLQRVKGLPPRD